ncbi:hypothetical protein F5Y17DRAFT_7271 [Xylariaceae sp. FL0594]|nr:hypothetical protein F5Y17DRAFT_7271 [Xylariaceae sp. FL0594]
MVSHYPLNGVDLDFKRYAPTPLGACDILAYRVMRDLLEMRRVPPSFYVEERKQPIRSFGIIKHHDCELALDVRVLWQLLRLEWPGERDPRLIDLNDTFFRPSLNPGRSGNGVVAAKPTPRLAVSSTLEEMMIHLIQVHYLQRSPLLRLLDWPQLRVVKPHRWKEAWKLDMVGHLSGLKKASLTYHQSSVYSKCYGHPHPARDGPQSAPLSIGPWFLAIGWRSFAPAGADRDRLVPEHCPLSILGEFKRSGYLAQPKAATHRRRMATRSQSVPVTERWGFAAFEKGDKNRYPGPSYHLHTNEYRDLVVRVGCNVHHIIFFPLKPLSELDKRSRRRSLSRSHIRAMFVDNIQHSTSPDSGRTQIQTHPCSNCAQYTHKTKECRWDCGHCGLAGHRADSCPMGAQNRCKCMPFPQFHGSGRCHVRCSRRCGNPHPPGDHRHKNAMLCSHRCCMCGVWGHSGRKCALKRCPCGGDRRHLTQDCRWKVECAAPGCSFYLCAIHCRECGTKREKGPENAFVARTCRDCLRNGAPVSPRAT